MHRGITLTIALIALVSFKVLAVSPASGKAERLFSQHSPQVYQIRVIDKASTNKFTIGSGFAIDPQGLLATNFHVISAYAHKPELYQIEAIDQNGHSHRATLEALDVVRDLALIKIPSTANDSLRLSQRTPAKGERIYSLGNPHDLGMTIIEGTYNGLVEQSRYRKILFSGALNSGMSGGPSLNETGEIVGVNVSVSRRGQQISFLVPVAHLQTLYQHWRRHGAISDYKQAIGQRLWDDQEAFYQAIFNTAQAPLDFAQLKLPGKLDPRFNCWGHSEEIENDEAYSSFHQHCKSDDWIYIDNAFYSGTLSYDYHWVENQGLNPFQFSSLIEDYHRHLQLNNVRSEKTVDDFHCHDDFVALSGREWKASLCLRAYKDYQDLHDALFLLSSVGNSQQAFSLRLSAAGLSLANAKQLAHYFMEQLQW